MPRFPVILTLVFGLLACGGDDRPTDAGGVDGPATDAPRTDGSRADAGPAPVLDVARWALRTGRDVSITDAIALSSGELAMGVSLYQTSVLPGAEAIAPTLEHVDVLLVLDADGSPIDALELWRAPERLDSRQAPTLAPAPDGGIYVMHTTDTGARLARLAADRSMVWERAVGTDRQFFRLASNGTQLAIGGDPEGPLDFDGTVLGPFDRNALIVLDADGHVLHSFATDAWVDDIELTSTLDVWASCYVGPAMSFGTQPIDEATTTYFVARIAPDGSVPAFLPLLQRDAGAVGDMDSRIAIAGDGLLFAGSLPSGTINIAGVEVIGASGDTLFVARVAADGTATWVTDLGIGGLVSLSASSDGSGWIAARDYSLLSRVASDGAIIYQVRNQPNPCEGRGVAALPSGEGAFFVGAYRPDIQLGTFHLEIETDGDDDMFVACMRNGPL